MAAQNGWREFTRAKGPDESKLADADFIKRNLNDDFFGKWLQEGDNSP